MWQVTGVIFYSKNEKNKITARILLTILMIRVILSLATGSRCHNKETPLVCAVTPLLCLCCWPTYWIRKETMMAAYINCRIWWCKDQEWFNYRWKLGHMSLLLHALTSKHLLFSGHNGYISHNVIKSRICDSVALMICLRHETDSLHACALRQMYVHYVWKRVHTLFSVDDTFLHGFLATCTMFLL